jgi:hypothetical protein
MANSQALLQQLTRLTQRLNKTAKKMGPLMMSEMMASKISRPEAGMMKPAAAMKPGMMMPGMMKPGMMKKMMMNPMMMKKKMMMMNGGHMDGS